MMSAQGGHNGVTAFASQTEGNHLPDVRIISIIDDDETVRSSLRSPVRSLGLDACTFASAEDFLNSSHQDDTSCRNVPVAVEIGRQASITSGL
jgi:hypothetical protein